MIVGGILHQVLLVINFLQQAINEGTTCFTLGGSPVGRSLTLDFGVIIKDIRLRLLQL